MKVIRPACRIQLTAEDVNFITRVLGERMSEMEALSRLLADETSRDTLLDDERLLRAILEARGCLSISTPFYFYILVRHAFLRAGMSDRAMADYVAAVLAEYSDMEASRLRLRSNAPPLEYFVDMLAALQHCDDTARFYLRAFMGNTALFLSGIFPDRIRYRAARRGAPSLGYYTGLGRASYREAGEHRLARQYELDGIFDQLAERFEETRCALNDLRDHLISLDDHDPAVEAMLSASARLWS
ncbi:hypothetical protein NXS98_02210 [Fontisphaera persica]|uniref:hypothetical protein n=1 Tax=Fontisphaera persica TaxID=2974023 RepID=UPI0024C075CB|nr:hypothetical protein [Fontisphaera persica]WCJ59961.1 hypothetical protein NXS98_02210 [Fontisphaera persica]